MNDARRTRVLLTRSAEDNADWARELRARGYEAVECASLVEQRLDTGPALARELEHADWIAFTSRRAVDASHDLAPRLPDRVRVAAVGPATEERVRERFGRCDSVSRAGNAADLGTELVRLGARHVVVAAARGGLFDVERALTAAGRTAARVELYEMTPTAEPLPPAALDVDAAFFASPSAVQALSSRGTLPATCVVVSIGPTTSAALRAAGLSVHAESRTRDLDGMITALSSLTTSER
ncbi:MAG: uroporphyrinogen-III synthase [Planctomycetes bacterium]|nr:uroporphyrinogen-III synthase [Planctomycetota bacterium]MCB9903792.1 uroporphyrinogen-III synthase [Planctomycetota bacterium]